MMRLVLVAVWAIPAAVAAADPDAGWRPPYRTIYGAYSMKPGDWALWDGVVNLVHYAVVGREATDARRLLDTAGKHGMKVFSPVSVWNFKTAQFDDSRLRQFLDEVGRDHPALFGYVYEAAYRIPPDTQKQIYDTIKRLDPVRPVWMEFSSTSPTTWQRFNPQACDAVLSYNYPYEKTDKADTTVARVDYSVRALGPVKPRPLPVIPLLQAFSGSKWRVVPRGGMAAQFEHWLAAEPVAGIAFYRWRTSGPYAGILEDASEDSYTWKEIQELCRRLAGQQGPMVVRQSWTGKTP